MLELRKVGFMGYSRLYRFKKLKALNFQCVLVMRFYRIFSLDRTVSTFFDFLETLDNHEVQLVYQQQQSYPPRHNKSCYHMAL